jgi:hypothetical protein
MPAIVIALLVALALAGCGERSEPTTGTQETRTGASTAPALSGETTETVPGAPQPCGEVTITPNSGDGLFEIEATGIRCDEARAVLEEWGKDDYSPSAGPRGYDCETIKEQPAGNSRLRCAGPGGGTIEFDTGL